MVICLCGPRHAECASLARRKSWLLKFKTASDVIGLTKVPPSLRRGFMTASAAVTAGYTLAAGPVRAEAFTTPADGFTTGEAKIKVADGEMPSYFARQPMLAIRRSCWWRWRSSGCTNNIKDVTRRLCQARRARGVAGLLIPQGHRPHQDRRHQGAVARS